MNAYRANGGCSGTAYDRYVEQRGNDNKSAITKMQHQYWVTKQTVFRKLGKKEDDCIIASDAELDAKLELFRSIQESCTDLQRIIDKYQERLCSLAQEENAMGRFLKEAGKTDKTRAGKMMSAVGKSLSYSGQQRLTLRMPLLRLYQEVETFRHRAIEDTLHNVNSMEKIRTEYRASLNWMKNVSQELDPDTFKQLERFRKVQGQVRRSKVRFDQLKLDCLQKVDLLAAARCNMFSHALILYQNSLLQFAEKTAKTFKSIANSFKGYQHYEFCVVKELAEPSLKLAELSSKENDPSKQVEETDEDKDKLLFFESEYHDDDDDNKKEQESESQTKSQSLENLFPSETRQDVLLDLSIGSNEPSSQPSGSNGPSLLSNDTKAGHEQDLLTSNSDDLLLLDEILHAGSQNSFGSQWDEVFGSSTDNKDGPPVEDTFLPPELLDQFAAFHTDIPKNINPGLSDNTSTAAVGPTLHDNQKQPFPMSNKALLNNTKDKGQDKRAAWFNLFADLDPLADPDAVGRKADEDDRKC
ncbi:hypothetical protein R5R35_000391 [Gryllus longicercus]|uniref:AH domain-containing protein n=1 Tax=Gryllus longicercus TaxID=2509291 RepID=A0AAN9Z2C2_9ORTH